MKDVDVKARRIDEKELLARDVSRFKTLYPNGEAVLKKDPSNQFGYMNSAEMVALNS